MTVSQLYNSVAQLGFEDSLEDEKRFVFAANRALLQVNALRPATSAYVINHKPMPNKVHNANFESIEKTDDLCFCAENVKSYYFEVDGNGAVYIEVQSENSEEWTVANVIEFATAGKFKAYKGFINLDGQFISTAVRLRFTGQYKYSVKCVAMYEHLYSENEKDIPAYEPYSRYDISVLANDFLSLASPPLIETNGEYYTHNYNVENGRIILLPFDIKGIFKIIYNRLPKEIENTGAASQNQEVIDLDEDLCALLPILIASYVWVDDEPEKAQYYLALYRERAADVERRIYDATPVPIINTNGW
jgi:hypothetical protein